MHVPKELTRKLDARAKKVVLVGYDGEWTNYRLYHPDTNKVTISRNVVFREGVSESKCKHDTSDEEAEVLFPIGQEQAEPPNDEPRADV